MPDSTFTPTVPFTLDVPTVLSIATALSLLPLALTLSTLLIPSSQTRNRLLFFWHAYDALTHLLIEGSFLYHCFFSYTTIQDTITLRGRTRPYFLDYADRLYGPAYGSDPTARMWQEYGKADARWLGADLGVVSLEILTVLLGGPIAVYICYLLYKSSSQSSTQSTAARYAGKLWVLAIGLAVAELYGGFMTFAPEWLSGNTGLETGHPMYLWLYLVFFNCLWVVSPIWVLCLGWGEVKQAFVGATAGGRAERDGKKGR